MATSNARTVRLDIKPGHYKTLINFLKTLPYVELTDDNERLIEASQAKPGERPADFAGIWKNDKRDVSELREKAWGRKK
jgi:hypothetical protein